MDARKYGYRVVWSEEDGEFVATCLEFPSLSHLDKDPVSAMRGIGTLVASVVKDMGRRKEVPPEPLFNRSYSGVFKVRVPPEVHRNLVIQAAENNVSVNRLVSSKLSG